MSEPRGLAVAGDGTVYVADTGNHRVQQFGADGRYMREFGRHGGRPGELTQPSGIAVDSRGHAFVADLAHRVQEFDDHGELVGEWQGMGFYGPRDVAVGADDSVYVLDQGHARVVRRAPDGTVTTFGTYGEGRGQLNDPTGLATGAGRVVVADPRNQRIVIFSTEGTFERTIAVPEWGQPLQFPDVAIAERGSVVYASSPGTNEIFVYTLTGERTAVLRAAASRLGPLATPSSLALTSDGALLVAEVEHGRLALVRPPSPVKRSSTVR